MVNVVVIDYGTGNIKSIQRGLEKVGASVTLSSLPEVIISADHFYIQHGGKNFLNFCRKSARCHVKVFRFTTTNK